MATPGSSLDPMWPEQPRGLAATRPPRVLLLAGLGASLAFAAGCAVASLPLP